MYIIIEDVKEVSIERIWQRNECILGVSDEEAKDILRQLVKGKILSKLYSEELAEMKQIIEQIIKTKGL